MNARGARGDVVGLALKNLLLVPSSLPATNFGADPTLVRLTSYAPPGTAAHSTSTPRASGRGSGVTSWWQRRWNRVVATSHDSSVRL